MDTCMGRLRSRKITDQDLLNFYLILAVDTSNLTEFSRLAPSEHLYKFRVLLSFEDWLKETDLPEPYFGNFDGFEFILGLCEAGVSGLLKHKA